MSSSPETKFPYIPFDTYCIRSPLLSLEFYLKLVDTDEISDVALRNQLQTPLVSEAIYLASPELYTQLTKWAKGHITEAKKVKRLRAAFLKYLTRMSTRCTPFGLFASVGAGILSRTTQIEPKPHTEFLKMAQYDMQFLASLANYLSNTPHIKKQLLFFPNSSLYKIGSRYRYVEYTYADKKRIYNLESVAFSSYLEEIFAKAKQGATLDTLVKLLENQEIETNEAADFIDELVLNQLLISELEPTITGDDFLQIIKTKISALTHVDKELSLLKNLLEFLDKLNQQLGTPIALYESLKDVIAKLEIPVERKYLLQVDTFGQYHNNTLSYDNVKKVKQCMAFLNKIGTPRKMESLEKFKADFHKRFEHQKVPLMQLLDVETGIGYGQNPTNIAARPFLDDIVYYENRRAIKKAAPRTPLYSVLQSKLATALTEKQQIIELNDSDFPHQTYNWKMAPSTVSVIAELVSDQGQETVIMSHYLEHAGRLLGRFGHGSEHLENLLKNITEKEAEIHSDYILAEVVHLPEARTGNILRRPVLGDFEIPYLGKSNLADDQQLHMDDLLVSVDNGLVVLHSKKLNKRILPKLSNAHNFSDLGLPTYRFLCDLQYQEQQGFGFNWPVLLSSHQFLPRVIYKNCILSRAQWNLKKKQIESLLTNLEDKNSLLAEVSKLQEEFSLPNLVQLVDGDNTLVVHLKNYTSVCMFLETIKNKLHFTLEEFLWSQKQKDNTQKQDRCAEFVLSFYKNVKQKEKVDD